MGQLSIYEAAQQLSQLVEEVNEAAFFAPFGEKWSIGQNIQHLSQSAQLLLGGLAMTPAQIMAQFGPADQPTRSLETMVELYTGLLSQGVKAPRPFIPQLPENPQKTPVMQHFLTLHEALEGAFGNWSKADLDSHSIPHPVLKNISLREMSYFIAYHVGHHQRAIERILQTSVE
jgi:DinB superfamily